MEADEEQLLELLQERGYAPSEDVGVFTWPPTGPSIEDSKAQVILKFQEAYSLNLTGELDAETIAALTAPRCGNPDTFGPLAMLAETSKWQSDNLTISIENDFLNFERSDIERIIERASRVWINAVEGGALSIKLVANNGDIQVSFGSGHHGDMWPFRTGDEVLAHAFLPGREPTHLEGQIHFDTSEDWSIADLCPKNKKDFFTVAIHEVGHALGLEHITDHKNSVMYTHYEGVRQDLFKIDIERINKLYAN